MSSQIKKQSKKKHHPRNKNRDNYNLSALIKVNPGLKKHIIKNKFGANTVDFSKPEAVKKLNTALLNHYYGIKSWKFPDENLCPAIPGRADYIHHIADLLTETNAGKLPKNITCLDTGIGASCIYPLIGTSEYGWNFIGSEVDQKSLVIAQNIIYANPSMKEHIECRFQKDKRNIFYGIIRKDKKIDITMCNPPFHSSLEEAQRGTRRKIKNLSGKTVKQPELNFAGISNELIFEGGEYKFIQKMIRESENFAQNCCWFTTLVSKKSNLVGTYKALKKVNASQVKTIDMETGNKSSRIVAWTFLTKEEQKKWKKSRWKQ